MREREVREVQCCMQQERDKWSRLSERKRNRRGGKRALSGYFFLSFSRARMVKRIRKNERKER
jgi:hypothetical protein